jgi:uncharacterized membrane protein (DUF485 family)
VAREGQLAREVRTGLEQDSIPQNGTPNTRSESSAPIHVVGDREAKNVRSKRQSSKKQSKKEKTPLLDQLYFGKPKRQHLREFGCLFGAIFGGIAAYQMYHGNLDTSYGFIVATTVCAFLAYTAPIVLYPLWSGWMAFANGLGHVMSFVFVGITWVVMAVPLAFLLRLIGKKVMDLSFDRSVESYWEEREEKQHDFQLLERQF